jgi:hypothetical protein
VELLNRFFFNPVDCCFLYKAKDLSALPSYQPFQTLEAKLWVRGLQIMGRKNRRRRSKGGRRRREWDYRKRRKKE